MEGLINAEGRSPAGQAEEHGSTNLVHCDHEFNELGFCRNCNRAIIELAAEQARYERMRRVLDLVAAERVRQRALLADGVILCDCSDPATPFDKTLRTATEELGEVAKEIDRIELLTHREQLSGEVREWRRRELRARLRNEWVQMAAVAVAAAESLEELLGVQPSCSEPHAKAWTPNEVAP